MMTTQEPLTTALATIPAVLEEIRQVYRQHAFPWVIGYSGGKDSTTALQLVWLALAGLPPEERTQPVHVISSDTLVETPMIVDYINDALDRINRVAAAQQMPFTARKLTPTLDDTFWVNLIGRGYPAPNDNFRWCTERLKIRASNRFILEQVAEHGEVILVLGTRRGESATRDQVMNLHRVAGYKLARHGQLPGAWVYMPIEHFTVNDVWTYLSQVPSPWGSDNRQLAALYRSAQQGECPLVIDTSTASCGNSRFGCWVCTVVEKDRSMEAMIDHGEEWMIPLLEFRDRLAETQDPANKPDQREYRGRDGRIKTTKDGRILYRTYTLEFSKTLLRDLLETEKTIQTYDAGFQLIGEDELREIRRLWIAERQDWADSLPAIYRDVTGRTLAWEVNDSPTPGQLEAALLAEVTTDADVPLRLVQKLLDAEWQHYGMRRRSTIHKAIEKVLGEDWRALEQVLADAQHELEGEIDRGFGG
jgi:DNA sulfur modification protein DndC